MAKSREYVQVGQQFGKWRVTELYDWGENGPQWAVVVNTQNLRISSRCPVTDLPSLGK
jgi:hypothetical protein